MNALSPPNIAADENRIIEPSNTIRVNAWGTAASSPALAVKNNTDVIAINNSILGMLADGDVRRNYIFIGATWTPNGAQPTSTNGVGTNKLANSTMETYHQDDLPNGTNCFSCHNNDMLNNVSHIFQELKQLFP